MFFSRLIQSDPGMRPRLKKFLECLDHSVSQPSPAKAATSRTARSWALCPSLDFNDWLTETWSSSSTALRKQQGSGVLRWGVRLLHFVKQKRLGFFLKNSIVLTDVDSGNFRRGGGDSTKSSKNFEMPPGFWPPPTWEGNQKVKRGGSHTGLDAGVIHLGVHCAPLSKSSLGVS